jgi:hypothetical protein
MMLATNRGNERARRNELVEENVQMTAHTSDGSVVSKVEEVAALLRAATAQMSFLERARAAARSGRTATPYGAGRLQIEPQQRVQVNTWDDPFSEADPSDNPNLAALFPVDLAAITDPQMQIAIAEARPAPGLYRPGTDGFRYWVAAEALARGIAFWTAILPAGTMWSSVSPLPVTLVAGRLLNAFYRRDVGLQFFHDTTANFDVRSCESPDVVCHELGHAILDALKPQLFDAALIETAAFHESFGDMSAILCALQVPQLRQLILTETGGRLNVNSRMSRLAEQLGWALRQKQRSLVDSDCLRNAANRFFYRDPNELPPKAGADLLSSESHSFSRVFTAGFLDALARMAQAEGPVHDQSLITVARNMGQLLVDAIYAAPITENYYSQVAAAMVHADVQRFGGRYQSALSSAFVERGILSVDSAMAVSMAPRLRWASLASREPDTAASVSLLVYDDAEIDEGFRMGVGETQSLPLTPMTVGGVAFEVHGPGGVSPSFVAEPHGFAAASADPQREETAALDNFVRGLIHNRRIAFGTTRPMSFLSAPDPNNATHSVTEIGGKLVLKRNFFMCGCCNRPPASSAVRSLR